MSCTGKFRDELHSRGLRVTPQREAVLAALHHFHSAATAEEICQEVHRIQSGIPMSTVYRTLDLLRSFGLVSILRSNRGGNLYLHDASEKRHLHCERCGRIVALEADDVEAFLARIRTRFDFDVDLSQLSLSGTCGACR